MNTSSSPFFDTAVLGQLASSSTWLSAPAKTVSRSRAGTSASLWRHALTEGEAAGRHGIVVRSFFALLGVLSVGSVAVTAWEMHALLAGNGLQAAVAAFLR